MVAGALYKFDLVLNHSDGEGCKGSDETETCTLVVWEQTWRDFRYYSADLKMGLSVTLSGRFSGTRAAVARDRSREQENDNCL